MFDPSLVACNMRTPSWIVAKNGTRHFFYRYGGTGDVGLSACGHWKYLLTEGNFASFLGMRVIDAEPKKHCKTCTKMVTKWAAQGALAALDG